jgi:hypothetical protein
MLINLPKQFQRRCTAIFVPKKRAWIEGTRGYPRVLTLFAYLLDLSDDGCLCANAVYQQLT